MGCSLVSNCHELWDRASLTCRNLPLTDELVQLLHHIKAGLSTLWNILASKISRTATVIQCTLKECPCRILTRGRWLTWLLRNITCVALPQFSLGSSIMQPSYHPFPNSFTQHERRHRRALRLIGMGPWAIRLVQGLSLTRLPGTTITTSVDAPTPLETFSKPPPVPQTTI